MATTLGFTDLMMSSDELFLMPDGRFRYDLIPGELLRMTPAGDSKTRSMTEYRPDTDPHIWSENDALDGPNVVPGFTLGVGVLFRGLAGR